MPTTKFFNSLVICNIILKTKQQQLYIHNDIDGHCMW